MNATAVNESNRSLFNDLITEITYETSYFGYAYSKVQKDGMVHYLDSRTGRETSCSAGHYCAVTSLEPGLRKRWTGEQPGQRLGQVMTTEKRKRAAILEFLEDNARCRDFTIHYDPWSWDSLSQEIRGEVMILLDDNVNGKRGIELNCSAIAHGMISGPGASSDVSGDAGSYGRDNDKMSFSSPIVRNIYKILTHSSPLSLAAETVRQTLYGEHDSVDSHAVFLSVPKTWQKERGICTQPSGNMKLQLSTHKWICSILRAFFDCDLQDQQMKNRHLAYLGSRGAVHGKARTWSFHTWDLSRASNFPWILIHDMFPSNVSGWLDTIRSSAMEIDLSCLKSRENITLLERKYMCSTMGNGFTFALMTWYLSAIVKVLYGYFNLPEYDIIDGRRVKTWAVYGDDIIVDARLRFALPRVLRSFGFLVNHAKSCTTGLFRESCGGDYYDGQDVRPVFVETLDNVADVYSLINRLNNWSVLHSVPLPRSIHTLRRWAWLQLGKRELRIPNFEDVSAGVHVPYALSYPSHHHKGKATESSVIDDNGQALPLSVIDLEKYGGRCYRALLPRQKRVAVFREKLGKTYYCDIASREVKFFTYVKEVKWLKGHRNVYAVLLHTLGGTVRQGQYGLRSKCTHMDESWRYAPSWGYNPDPGGTVSTLRRGAAPILYKRWETLTTANLALNYRKELQACTPLGSQAT